MSDANPAERNPYKATGQASSDEKRRLKFWQIGTALALALGYAGYYICRSNLSVVSGMPDFQAEFGGADDFRTGYGTLASFGIVLYVCGKFINGAATDWMGGRRMMLLGVFVSVIATICFGFSSGLVLFLVFWAFNRFIQAGGWAALVKVAGNWFPKKWYGSILGFLSISYLVGDGVARSYLGAIIFFGGSWQTVFFVAATSLALIGVLLFFFLKESPVDRGLPEPRDHDDEEPDALTTPAQDDAAPTAKRTWLQIVTPLFGSLSFWMVCYMSCGLTLIRETFNNWLPVLLSEMAGADAGMASIGSSVFPYVGALSVLIAGYLSDSVARGNRAKIILPGLLLATLSLFILTFLAQTGEFYLILAGVALFAFFFMGPYSFLGGVIALDLGGRDSAATASGVIDGVGYAGGTLAGIGVSYLVGDMGWLGTLVLLSLIGGSCALAAVVYWLRSKGVTAA